MKVLIVSDSHGLVNELQVLKERHKEEAELFLHCGDSELPIDDKAISGYVVVQGNCDYYAKYPEETIQEVNGKKLLMVHGHLYGVKSSVSRLLYRAKEVGAQIACFGHSHYLGMEMIEDVLFINPGSLRLPRGRMEKTYVILSVEDKTLKTEVYDFDKGLLPELTAEFPI
ncbi:metallophosphoesterase [Niallia taxi]|uniref:Phosphoesterase n=1 Tax=Niallia taxi TaxID=2499688 RepID=A0A3S2UGI3_9BACI|nr:metallophosphoesterase [Niallia taxi]MED4037515.1 metallophosphoesterase [Niallia taxi]RVT65023.1 metallophosphoesterase [Niallia taxi]